MHNGNCGMTGQPANYVFENNITNNNSWRFGYLWQSGGMKFTHWYAENNIFIGVTSSNNVGPGIWFDFAGPNNLIKDSTFDNNFYIGVDIEATEGPTYIVNNIISNTKGVDPNITDYPEGMGV